tara:strand:+ start:1834 stop:2763 length:930 start_codon:yes stop_codon:yes gene_type:complete
MKKFIRKTIKLIIPLTILSLLWVLIYGFPPPNLSPNISFNARMFNLKERHIDVNIDVLAIGSSMSLNNIHTKTIKNNLSEKYLNISSWGQKIEDDFKLIKILTKHYKPKKIIISSNFMDFGSGKIGIKYNLIDSYLFKNEIKHYTELNIQYLLKESRSYFNKKRDGNNYKSLMYDDCGGINFKSNNFNISLERWNGYSINKFKKGTNQYYFLDSISKFCKEKDITFVFVQSPFREGYVSLLNEHELSVLNNHKNKIESILKRNNNLFIDSQKKSWEDDLFVDYSHLNSKGAKKYTEYFLKEIDKAQLSK